MTPRPVSVQTTRLERAADGTPYSREYADIYHASAGGLAQSRHVFLAGNRLPERWRAREAFTILETGFGLGLNFLATWAAWRADPGRCARLHFVSVEKNPFPRDDLAAALAPFEEIAALSRALASAWPPPIAGFHRVHFEGGRIALTLALGDARECLAELRARVDAFYLDGFAPARNPGMWSPEVVRELARVAAPGATLATWTVAGGVRAALSDAGFRVEKREGFGTKREMLVGTCPGDTREPAIDRRALVVGAGLAGVLAAERLGVRGWSVALVDEREAQMLPRAALVRPIANARDALNAQLSRSAFLYALQHFRALQQDGYHLEWNPCGVLQVASDADEEARFRAIVAAQAYPPAFLGFVDSARAAERAGRPVARGGWWFPGGAVVAMPSLVVASRARAGASLRRIAGRRVARVEREGAEWRALDGDGRVIAEAPALVLANAADAARLLPAARLRLSTVRGQVTYLAPDEARRLPVVVSGNGYVAPLPDGGLAIGASYRHDDPDASVREPEHRENLARAESMLPGLTSAIDPAGVEGWAGFRATVPDRLPIYGATDLPGAFVATGLGSRGLLWAPLGAELLACELASEPLPLPAGLAAAISPRRFLA